MKNIILLALSLSLFVMSAQAAELKVSGYYPEGTVVFVAPVSQGSPDLNKEHDVAIIKQKDLQFEPKISVVRPGQSVQFPNFDKTAHHVYSFSKAKRFEIPLNQEMTQTIRFGGEGVVAVGCNIHDWMLAYIIVSDAPYYSFLDWKNQMPINVPEGTYYVSYWHPNKTELTFLDQQYVVNSGDAVLDVTLPIEEVKKNTDHNHGQHMKQPDPAQNYYNQKSYGY